MGSLSSRMWRPTWRGSAATSVPGVYAAGDVTPGFQLVQVAAAKGTTAGIACAQSLAQTPDLA